MYRANSYYAFYGSPNEAKRVSAALNALGWDSWYRSDGPPTKLRASLEGATLADWIRVLASLQSEHLRPQ